MCETAIFITQQAAETGCKRIIKAMRLTDPETKVTIRRKYTRGEIRGYTAQISNNEVNMTVTEGILDNARQVA